MMNFIENIRKMIRRYFRDYDAQESEWENERVEAAAREPLVEAGNRQERQRKAEHRQSATDEHGLDALYSYLAENYRFRYNLLTDRTEVGWEDAAGTMRYRVVNKRTMNDIALDAISHQFKCWDRDVKRWVESNQIVGYHPFWLYLSELPEWDGEDRVAPLAGRVSSETLWINGFHRWMLGMVASWMDREKSVANSLAPILVSTEQGWGKSTFARSLMPETLSPYFSEAYDLSAPTTCVRQLSTFGLINLDEFDKIPARKMPQLKTLMQMAELRVRKAYQPQEEVMQRLASFVGTSNRRDLLTDVSGSRRFLCVELEQPISREPICHKQLFAQLKAELEQGERFWLSKAEEAEIQQHNRRFYVETPVVDLFREVFETSGEGGQEGQNGLRLMSAAEVFATLKRRNPAAMRGVDIVAFGRLLPSLAMKVHTKYGNGYWLRERA